MQRDGERERASTSERGVGRERSAASSGVKLLRWKIALTVMMLLFRGARVTLSFTSATPAAAARLPVSRKAAHCQVSEHSFLPVFGEAGHWGAPGMAILGELGWAGPFAPLSC